jgi:hypothetical protein
MRLLLILIISFSFFSAQASEPITKSVITKPVIKKTKLLRSNPHRFTAIRLMGQNPWTVVDDEDIIPQRKYRFKLEPDSDELSEHVRFRLWLARHLALKKFVETHGQAV